MDNVQECYQKMLRLGGHSHPPGQAGEYPALRDPTSCWACAYLALADALVLAAHDQACPHCSMEGECCTGICLERARLVALAEPAEAEREQKDAH